MISVVSEILFKPNVHLSHFAISLSFEGIEKKRIGWAQKVTHWIQSKYLWNKIELICIRINSLDRD